MVATALVGAALVPGAPPALARSLPSAAPASAVTPTDGWSRAVLLACNSSTSTVRGCNSTSLRAIDAARALSGLSPLVLPSGYWHLGVADQLVEVTNAERVTRGLPAWSGPVPALTEMAVQGVADQADPSGPGEANWVSNLASGVLTVLEADYDWMYDDGPAGANPACNAPGAPACWQHRTNLLQPWAGEVGAAGAPFDKRLVLGELMVEGRHPTGESDEAGETGEPDEPHEASRAATSPLPGSKRDALGTAGTLAVSRSFGTRAPR